MNSVTNKIIFVLSIFSLTYSSDSLLIDDYVYYELINEAVIPYWESIVVPDMYFSTIAKRTIFDRYGDFLYDEAFSYLRWNLKFSRKEIRYMKKQLKGLEFDQHWNGADIKGIEVDKQAPRYLAYLFSRPIISSDENVFITIRYKYGKPAGPRCGTVVNEYIPMIFQKEDSKWEIKKTFRDPRLR